MSRDAVGLWLFFAAVLAGMVLLIVGAGPLAGAWLMVALVVAVRLMWPD